MWTNVDNRFPMAMIFDACMSQKLKKSLWVAEIRGYIQFLSQMQTFCTITNLLTYWRKTVRFTKLCLITTCHKVFTFFGS